MGISGILATDSVTGTITDFGYISPDTTIIINESEILRIEAKRRTAIGDIPLPTGVTFTLVVEDKEGN